MLVAVVYFTRQGLIQMSLLLRLYLISGAIYQYPLVCMLWHFIVVVGFVVV